MPFSDGCVNNLCSGLYSLQTVEDSWRNHGEICSGTLSE